MKYEVFQVSDEQINCDIRNTQLGRINANDLVFAHRTLEHSIVG